MAESVTACGPLAVRALQGPEKPVMSLHLRNDQRGRHQKQSDEADPWLVYPNTDHIEGKDDEQHQNRAQSRTPPVQRTIMISAFDHGSLGWVAQGKKAQACRSRARVVVVKDAKCGTRTVRTQPCGFMQDHPRKVKRHRSSFSEPDVWREKHAP